MVGSFDAVATHSVPRPEPVRWRAGDFWLAAVWFGWMAGLLESSIVAVRQFWLGDLMSDGLERVFSPHVLWMAPLADLCLFAVAGSVLLALARWVPWVVPPRPTMWLLAFAAALGVQMISARVATWAWLLLAAGLATRISGAVARNPLRFRALASRMTVWLTAAAVVLGLGMGAWAKIQQRRALAALPSAPADAPSVLLIVLDTVRTEDLSAYGYGRPTTPNIERLARAGVRFDRAFSPSPWTLPAHASMFTGRMPHETSADWSTPLDAKCPTLAEILAAHGYRTAGFAANRYYCSAEYGLGRGFHHYQDCFFTLPEIALSSHLVRSVVGGCFDWIVGGQLAGQTTAAQVNARFLQWLPDDNARPFFAFLNYIDAHDPYLAPGPAQGRFESTGRPTPLVPEADRYTADELRPYRDGYDECVAYIDEQLGALLDELQRRGRLESTLVIVTSDHGEQFGEHGLASHGNSLYMLLLHVPLIMTLPSRIPAGQAAREAASLRDLPATIVDLAGLGGLVSMPGNSLAPHWGEVAADHDHPLLASVSCNPSEIGTPVAKGDMQSVVLGPYHYIHNGDGIEELYDCLADPAETRDLLPRGDMLPVLERCRDALAPMLESGP